MVRYSHNKVAVLYNLHSEMCVPDDQKPESLGMAAVHVLNSHCFTVRLNQAPLKFATCAKIKKGKM